MTWMERVQQFFGGSGSKTDAKERLLCILADDRLGLTGEQKEELKKDLLAVIRKYVSIDADGFTMEFVPHPQNEIQMTAPVQPGSRPAPSPAE